MPSEAKAAVAVAFRGAGAIAPGSAESGVGTMHLACGGLGRPLAARSVIGLA
jgi:hypothetical protein